MLEDGFSEKFARFYLNILEEEKNNSAYDSQFVKWAHSKGFRAEVASLYDINDINYMNFLSDYDYYRIWPINNWIRIWINDKLALKYMLDGTEYSGIMPKYYYYTSMDGLRTLVDNPYKNYIADTEQFIKVENLHVNLVMVLHLLDSLRWFTKTTRSLWMIKNYLSMKLVIF